MDYEASPLNISFDHTGYAVLTREEGRGAVL